MMSVFVRICLSAVFVLLAGLGLAAADEPGTEDYRFLAEQLQTVQGVGRMTAACPADIWRSPRGKQKDWSTRACRADIQGCSQACTAQENGTACFAVARVMQTSGLSGLDLYQDQAFSLACAFGDPAGCTNRAAGIRNYPGSDDPYVQRDQPEYRSCLARSFSRACSAGDAWGCAMEGQALRRGEGVPLDRTRALSRLKRACAISKESSSSKSEAAPCRFAREQMEQLGVK